MVVDKDQEKCHEPKTVEFGEIESVGNFCRNSTFFIAHLSDLFSQERVDPLCNFILPRLARYVLFVFLIRQATNL